MKLLKETFNTLIYVGSFHSIQSKLFLNNGVVDTGCPEMVAGKAWIKTFENSMNIKCEIMDKKSFFKFGDVVAEVSHYVRILFSLRKIKEDIEVAVVDTNVPLLFSMKKLKE